MANVLAAALKAEVLDLGVKNDDASSEEECPWKYLNVDYYPLTPPISATHSQSDLTLPLSSVSAEEEPVVAVLGVGYVGSHLVDTFSRKFSVIGFDVYQPRVLELSEKYSDNALVEMTSNARDLVRATHFLISVPTLLRADRTIDSSYLREAIKTVGTVARRGSTIVVESSVAIGMTRQLLGPLATVCGFFAGMSPEVSPLP